MIPDPSPEQAPRVPRAPRALVLGALALLCLASVALRLCGTGFLLPHFTHLDGSILVRQTEIHREGATPETRREVLYGLYPHLASRLAALVPDAREGIPDSPELADQLARAGVHWKQFRQVSAVLSVLLVVATFCLARRFAGEGPALLAAALVATSALFGFYTSEVRPHGIASSAMAWAVLACLLLARCGELWAYLVAGAACGLAVGGLHYGLAVLPALGLAHLLGRGRGWLRELWKLALALALVALAVRVFYPFHFQQGDGFLALGQAEDGRQLNLSGQPLKIDRFDGSGFHAIVESLWSYDPWLFVLGLGGALWLAARTLRAWRQARPGKEAWVALGFVVPYTLVIGMYAETWERFLLPLLPWLALAAALTFGRALQRVPRALAALLVLLVLALPVACNLALVRARSAPDTYQLAARWVEAVLQPEHDRVQILPYVDLPLYHTQEAIDLVADTSISPWMAWESAHAPPERAPRYALLLPPSARDPARAQVLEDLSGFLAARRVGYVVLVVDESVPWLAGARAWLAEHALRVARFSPLREDRNGAEALYFRHLGGFPEPFFTFILRVARTGPTMEVFRLQN